MQPAIKVEHLIKKYRDVTAVDDISFEVEKGSFFAFLGVNGAGKSTTINCICSLLSFESGTIEIDGRSIVKEPDLKRSIGVVFQGTKLDNKLSLKENLFCRGACYGMTKAEIAKRIDYLDSLLSFGDFMNRPIERLSGGQKRKCDIARALLAKPEILILDEPTTGLDPATRSTLWGVIDKLRREGNVTVFLTTHYMEEAADADMIIIIDKGKIAAKGTPIELKNQYSGDYISLYSADEDTVKSLGYPYHSIAEGFRIAIPDTEAATQLIIAHPDIFKDYEVEKGKLDDVFLAVTGSRGGDEA